MTAKLSLDPDQIKRMAQCGSTVEEIAYVHGCSTKTIQRRYMEAYHAGLADLKIAIRKKQIEVALSGDKGSATMLIWLGKQLLGQSDKVETRDTTEKITDEEKASREELREQFRQIAKHRSDAAIGENQPS